jgi:hypothetical protein
MVFIRPIRYRKMGYSAEIGIELDSITSNPGGATEYKGKIGRYFSPCWLIAFFIFFKIGEYNMQQNGFLNGLNHSYQTPVEYFLPLGENSIHLNEWLDKKIRLEFLGKIQCANCGRQIKKSYSSGYCYPCAVSLPETDLCIVKPHECHYHLGTCRDPKFGDTHCMIPHYVYLAVSSGVKVGITRKHNQMKRWTDQGAIQAIPIAEVPTRKLAGELEVALSAYLPDKTDWRKMLKGEVEQVDLIALREKVFTYFPDEFKLYALREDTWTELSYPILEAVKKVKTYNLDKEPVIEDRLVGIKGQYLIFEQAVLNIRKYTGYYVQLSSNDVAKVD